MANSTTTNGTHPPRRAARGQIVSPDDGLYGGFNHEIDDGYNPADFIIPASDHQGHSERIYCRVQPQHYRAAHVLLKSGRFPFRTEGDLFRWAYVRGIKVLDQLEPMPGFLGAADAITEVLRQEIYLQEFNTMFASMEKVINAHIASGANGQARALLAKIIASLRTISAGDEYWKGKALEEVQRRFGHLLEGGRGKVKLLPQTEGGD